MSRNPVLDHRKKRQIVTLLTLGCSRRIAAQYVGCSPSTITRTAHREPLFAAEISRAETACEIEALSKLRDAARRKKHWQAAAWLLRHKNPGDYAPRNADSITREQLSYYFNWFGRIILEELAGQQRSRVLRRIQAIPCVDLGLPEDTDRDRRNPQTLGEAIGKTRNAENRLTCDPGSQSPISNP